MQKENPIAIDKVLFADHDAMRDSMETFDKIYGDLKYEFKKFLSVWM